MTASIHFDASDFRDLGRAIGRLPGDIKAKALSRALRHIRGKAVTRVVRRSSQRTKVQQKHVRALTTAAFNAGAGSTDIIMNSGWIALYKLGASQSSKGVRVRGRGSYKSAFISHMKSGHAGVFVNTGQYNASSKRDNAIRELFGANPAHDVTNNPDEFLQVLADLIATDLWPRTLHELDRILPR